MNKTPIEWTDFTVNPFRFRNLETGQVGHHCTKISPGCKNCYSSTMQAGPYLSGLTFIEENKTKGEFFLDDAVLQQVLRRKKPCRIFWCDMTDMFLEDYPDEWSDRCFAVMALTPHITHQVLTKRAGRMREYVGIGAADTDHCFSETGTPARVMARMNAIANVGAVALKWPLPNVHLGVSVEDKERADERIPELLRTSAAVRFISAKPLLGPLDLTRLRPKGCSGWIDALGRREHRGPSVFDVATGLDQVIIGGESGPGARPCDLAWIRSLVEQCKTTNVAAFVKQLGALPVIGPEENLFDWPEHVIRDVWHGGDKVKLRDKKGGDMSEWPEDLRVREYPGVRG